MRGKQFRENNKTEKIKVKEDSDELGQGNVEQLFYQQVKIMQQFKQLSKMVE